MLLEYFRAAGERKRTIKKKNRKTEKGRGENAVYTQVLRNQNNLKFYNNSTKIKI